MVSLSRPDSYDLDPVDAADFFERFALRPTDPDEVRRRLSAGERLETLDIPEALDRQLVVEPETGTALYRLVQLFGTPNVPGRVAGDPEMGDRGPTTWQYLFEVDYDRRKEDPESVPEEFALSVYDFRTDVSTGFAGWTGGDDGGRVCDPVTDPEAVDVRFPPAAFAERVVQLLLGTVEDPVPATHREVLV